MKRYAWQVDESTNVELKRKFFGGFWLKVNGADLAQIKLGKSSVTPFSLPDGREAELRLDRGLGISVDFELRVQGQVVLSDLELKQISCLKCGKGAKAGEKFCEKCGAPLPEAQTQRKLMKLRSARATILTVAALFLVFGAIMYFAETDTADKALANLATFKDSDTYPQAIGDVTYTVAELKEKVRMEPLQTAALNVFLCLVMVGLYFYSKRSPLVALVVALAVYASVVVVNMILDPVSIGQGIVMKLLIVGILVQGIRSALELRKTDA